MLVKIAKLKLPSKNLNALFVAPLLFVGFTVSSLGVASAAPDIVVPDAVAPEKSLLVLDTQDYMLDSEANLMSVISGKSKPSGPEVSSWIQAYEKDANIKDMFNDSTRKVFNYFNLDINLEDPWASQDRIDAWILNKKKCRVLSGHS